MGTKNNSTVVAFSIVILLLFSLLLLLTYNGNCKNRSGYGGGYNFTENFKNGTSVADISNKDIDFNNISGGIGNYSASEPMNGDETYSPVSIESYEEQNNNQHVDTSTKQVSSVQQPDMQSCFPRDRLSAADLLPKDAADSKWARVNPSGTGDIHDQNYLTAGYHIGVNTVGQSLRNANLQLRSEIPNPQNAVGPWMISTIEPDIRQNTMEIGSSPSY